MKSMRARRMKMRALILAMAVYAAGAVQADGPAAARNLFNHLAAGGQDIGMKMADAYVAPTLVRGMYVVSTAQGRFVGYTNEAGTLFGDSRGFSGRPEGAAIFAPLAPDQAAQLRREIAAHIDKSQLISVRYGNGATELFLFSAIDCPHCKELEDKLRGAKSENIAFYVVPSSLRHMNQPQGRQQWQKVAAIWCATDPARAWKTYWATGSVPAGGACPFSDPKAAERAQDYLWGMLKGVGVKLTGTPAFVRPDGLQWKDQAPLELSSPSAYWLAGAPQVGAADFNPRPVGLRKN
ncbi:MAG: thioredoxin fold domain-containing protein [Ottowia sp.]|uniref:thioredoxin fold domain-containing protein n=1 Tax=Ottowia sp. TaxID=1898956 RepID=UPI0039E3B8B3